MEDPGVAGLISVQKTCCFADAPLDPKQTLSLDAGEVQGQRPVVGKRYTSLQGLGFFVGKPNLLDTQRLIVRNFPRFFSFDSI